MSAHRRSIGSKIVTAMKLRSYALKNAFARLEPLADSHRESLRLATSDGDDACRSCGRAGRTSNSVPNGASDISSRVRRNEGVRTQAQDRLRGSTAFIDPDAKEATVENGAISLHPDERGGLLNPAAKRLTHGHAFMQGHVGPRSGAT